MADMICAWGGMQCPFPDCENCAVRERERNIRNIDKPKFVFCFDCVKSPECELVKLDNIDGCRKGIAYYEKVIDYPL